MFTQQLKGLKTSYQRAPFVQSVKVWDKKNTEEFFHDTEQYKILISLDFVVSKLA